ncbi:unnamed protein product [Adineta steineri]|uniref:G domain-containing protein n=3 Tax=Adineta steineri TaxID=433720 RepID=A0A814DMV5_9BILA|nr:unnamed protein product [Adineta steineri]CAF3608511.1 unnamed protein product [Adineta steineri]
MSHLNSVGPLDDHRTSFNNIPKILLIGETGVGKSTFINYLCNYFNNGSLNNLKIAVPCKYHPYSTENYSHSESNLYDVTQSKTSDCTQYIFTDSTTNKQYLFLDTPGLSDTRGTEQNENNINKMIDAITGLGNLTSVIILINGSMNRLTNHLRTIITCLNRTIPDIILENVIVILTNVKKHESSFDLNILNLHGKVYPFHMQNGAFVSNPQTWNKSIHDKLQYDWDYSMKQIKIIIETIDSFKQLSIDSFIQLKQIRNDIKSIIHEIHLEITQIQKIQNELFQLDFAFQQANQDTITYQDYIQFQTIEKIEIVDAEYHSTLCASCNQVCHNHCHLNETTTIGAQIFSRCKVMVNGKCQQCRNHCSYINHYHAKKTIQITEENLYDILDDLKKRYDQACVNSTNYQERILTIKETKEILEKTLKRKIHDIKKKSIELYQICSSFNLSQEFKYLIKQLKLESNLIKNHEIKIQTDNIIKYLIKFICSIEENRQKQSSMKIIDKEQRLEDNLPDIKLLKTVDLIQLYHNTNDHKFLTLILNELHQRAQGKSTNPLLTPNEIMIINKKLEKYKYKNIQELSYSYHKLQQQINKIIDSDIFQIVNVNSELLIENFIVQTLLDDKEKNDNDNQDTDFDATLHSFQELNVSTISFSSYPNTPRTSSSQSIHSAPYPNVAPIPQPIYPPPYPDTVSKTSNINITSIGFSHLTSAPYPSVNHPLRMPDLPDDYFSTNFDGKQSASGVFRLEDYRHDSADTKSATSSIDHHEHMPMPMPINNQPQSNNNAENQHVILTNNRNSIPDIISFSIDSLESSKSLLRYLPNDIATSLANENLHLLDNSRLLSMYTNANLTEDQSQKELIYQELHRRCYGEYPMLIKENKNLFDEKMKLNQMKTIDELVRTQLITNRKIRQHLKNNDVTLINEVPLDLIIEANVLNQLILLKSPM